jgi:hypothetical protein
MPVVRFSYSVMESLKIMIFWCKKQLWVDDVVDATAFDLDALASTRECIQEEKEYTDLIKVQKPKKPSPLNDMKKWRSFWENWMTYIGQLHGSAHILPCSYDLPGHGIVGIINIVGC